MRVRLNFVSNSSSSSFVVVGQDPKVLNYKVPKNIAKKIIDYVNQEDKQIKWDGKSSVYVTQEIRDEQVEFLGWNEYAPYDKFDCDEEFSKTVLENLEDTCSSVQIRKEHLDASFYKKEFKKKVKELSKKLNVKYKIEVF